MEDKIIISAINPIGFSELRPDLFYNYSHNPFECYAQKFENKDKTFIQILSEVKLESVSLVRIDDNKQEKSYSIARIGTANLSDRRTFSFITSTQTIDSDYDVYKVDIEFMGLSEGHYYIEVVPQGEIIRYSELIYVKQKWENTLWFEYRNSLDHGGFMFNNVDKKVGIRIDGTIREFIPGSSDNIYIDQVHNPTTLSSTPYRNFTLFVGGSHGVADYMADIINRVMTCDEVFIDGTQFNKTEESSWEMAQDPDVPFQSMSMTIQAVDPIMRYNFKNISLVEDILEPQLDWVIQRRNVNRTASSDFTISNIIEDKTTLEYITVYKHNATPYILKVGTIEGNSDILETQIQDDIETLHLRQNFSEPTTLYFTGISEEQDFHIVYEKLNKKLQQARSTDESNLPSLQKNMVTLYGGTIDEFAIDFDPSTGLGRTNGLFEGFAVCDGRNGTIDYTNSFAYGWDFENGQLGDIVGDNEITLTKDQLPKIKLEWKWSNGARNDLNKGRDGTVYTDMNTRANRPENNSPIDRFPLEEFGGDQPIDIRPRRVLSIYIQKIT